MASLFNLKRRLYDRAPGLARGILQYAPFPLVAGRHYRKAWRSGLDCDRLDRGRVELNYGRNLGTVLRFAVAHVPHYSRLRSAVERLAPLTALANFPVIDKEEVIAKIEDFLARPSVRPANYETTTGGTTGRQLRILLDDRSQAVEMAFMHRQWARVGYTYRSRKATFRGVEFPRAQDGVYWQLNPIYNEMQFSPMAMSEANLPEYWRRLVEYDPEYLHGYPSAISLLARFVIRNGLVGTGPRIKAALLGSEGCTPDQRQLIEEAFQTRVFSWYGHSERLVLAGECEHTSDYHHFPDYGYLEILDDAGNPVAVGERGEIVGTTFLNRSMVLIRYRTGDFATRLDWRCSCGRSWDRFTDVAGRWKQEMVIGKTGAPLSLAALNIHGPHFARVARYQYYQDTPGVCEIRVMPDPDFSERDRQAIAAAYARKAGQEIDFVVRVVADIPLTGRGKLKLLDSRLN